jgi:hypothetical protein
MLVKKIHHPFHVTTKYCDVHLHLRWYKFEDFGSVTSWQLLAGYTKTPKLCLPLSECGFPLMQKALLTMTITMLNAALVWIKTHWVLPPVTVVLSQSTERSPQKNWVET